MSKRYRVDYDLLYDWGAHGEFSVEYRTRIGARIAAFWNKRIGSWGGSAVLIDQQEEANNMAKFINNELGLQLDPWQAHLLFNKVKDFNVTNTKEGN